MIRGLLVAWLAFGALAACGRDARQAPPAAPSPFTCGEHTCDARTSYCELINTDVQALPATHTCKPLPPACLPGAATPPPCDCFPRTTRCRNFCRRLDTPGVPGFRLACFGGG